MIISNGAPNTTFFIRKNLGPINSLDDIVFSLCDSNTLTACTALLPNNKTIIQGMVQRAWYIDIPDRKILPNLLKRDYRHWQITLHI